MLVRLFQKKETKERVNSALGTMTSVVLQLQLPPFLNSQTLVDLCESKGSLVYSVSSRIARVQRDCFKNHPSLPTVLRMH